MKSQPTQLISLLLAGLIFLATWLLWSGIYTPLLNALGVLSCALVLWLAKRSGFFALEAYSLHLIPRLPKYWWWLAGEIVKANVAVARIVMARKMPISPTTVVIDASSLPPVGQAILANAITLTPSTISFDLDDGLIQIHSLTEESAAAASDGEMLRRAVELVGD